jgi:CheY-like chemotaxis protein
MAKVLLAEDDEFSRDMLVRRLKRQGYEMIAAADGREALRAVREHHPDLILMDLDMPVMDGHTATRILKSDPRSFKIPIIVLTACASPEDVAKAVAAGCYAYETKPIVLSRLVKRIEEALRAPAPELSAI